MQKKGRFYPLKIKICMSTLVGEEAMLESLKIIVDDAIDIQLQIDAIKESNLAPLEEKLKAMKQRIGREMKNDKLVTLASSKGKVTLVSTTRVTIDVQGLCVKHGLSDSDKSEFSKLSTSTSVKLTPKKK